VRQGAHLNLVGLDWIGLDWIVAMAELFFARTKIIHIDHYCYCYYLPDIGSDIVAH
jgi:hypothetical protein